LSSLHVHVALHGHVASQLIVHSTRAWLIDRIHWFNRNLAIITNIERLFLNSDDLKLVHPFFGKHRAPGKYAQHFEIQFWLSGAVGALVLCYHFVERVIPGFSLPLANFQLARALPYLLTPVVLIALVRLHRHYVKKDEEFQQKSPGIVL
ncbi:hypothetical protein, partial [Variovorax beijingensis]|uniref:hypothetical protein n=1 Tax=Variovorax beijingensis TaxID=2496117 RepID=UPI0016489F86